MVVVVVAAVVRHVAVDFFSHKILTTRIFLIADVSEHTVEIRFCLVHSGLSHHGTCR